MDEERIVKLYTKADNLLSNATDELFKPQEDVVNYSACISARSALYHFLGCLYLYHTDEEIDNSLEKGKLSIDELLDFAEQFDSEIGEINFDLMRCSCENVEDILNNEEIYFCNNTEIVQGCTNLAKKVKKLVVANAFDGVAPRTETLKG